MSDSPLFLFNHGSFLAYLMKAENSPLAGTDCTLVELATTPYLAHFGGLQTPSNFPGIVAALDQDTKLGDLAIKLPDCRHLLIPAPGERVSGAAVAEAWQQVWLGGGDRLVGLISMTEAAALLSKIEAACPVSVFWDVDYPPTGDLSWAAALASYLKERPDCAVWGGMHLFSGSRLVGVSPGDEICPLPLRELSDSLGRLEVSATVSSGHATT